MQYLMLTLKLLARHFLDLLCMRELKKLTQRNIIRHIMRLACLLCLFALPALACQEATVPIDPTEFVPDGLSGEDFTLKILSLLDLSGKNLQGAKLSGASLKGTSFEGRLRNANLSGAILAFETNFTNADLRRAILNRACFLEEAIWTNAKLDPKWAKLIKVITEGPYSGQDLSEVDFSRSCINGIDGLSFAGVNFSSSDF